MLAAIKWIAWLAGAGLAVAGIVFAVFGEISGLAAFGAGLCLIGVGIAIKLLVDIRWRIGIMYSDHMRNEKGKQGKTE